MTTQKKQYIPIFVSSTYEDLEGHRQAVFNVLQKLKVAANGMEIFGARSQRPLQTCLEEVAKAKVFIGIIGMRYGSIDADSSKSFVQMEYETACKNDLQILIYLMDEENARISPKLIDCGDGAAKLSDFKADLRNNFTTESFINPDDLSTKVERDLRKLLKDQFELDESKLEPSGAEDKARDVLYRFNLMPAMYTGSEIEMVVKFSGEPKAVERSECAALGLNIGQAIYRGIEIVNPPNIKMNSLFASYLYAERDRCNFIYEAKDGDEYRILARLAYGEREEISRFPNYFYHNPFPLSVASSILHSQLIQYSEKEVRRIEVKALVFIREI